MQKRRFVTFSRRGVEQYANVIYVEVFSFFVLLLFLSVGVEGKISLRVIAVPPGVIIKDVNNPFAIFALKLISFEASSTSSSSSSLVNARMLFKTSSFEKHKKRGHVFPSVIYTIPSLIR